MTNAPTPPTPPTPRHPRTAPCAGPCAGSCAASSRLFWAALSVVALLVVAGRAAAQALGDGTALDASLRAGGTGKNDRRGSFEAQRRLQEAIFTGNAGDGKSFRGSRGYGATNDFRGTLGSNSLYNFRRDSISSALGTQNLRSADAVRFRSSISDSSVLPPALARTLTPAPAGRAASGDTLSTIRALQNYQYQAARRPTILNFTADREGNRALLTASTLRGISALPLEAQVGQVGLIAGLDRQPRRAGPLAAPLTAPLTEPDAKSASDDPRRDERSPFLDRYRQQDGQGDQAPSNPGDPKADTRPRWERDLEELRRQFRERSAAEPDAKPTQDGRPDRPSTDGRPGDQTDNKDLEPSAVRKRVIENLKRMNKPAVAPIDPAAAARDAYMMTLVQGQRLLQEGRYFDAEAAFERALVGGGRDNLAQAGRIHAQIGAGVYLSAASNLRTLLQEHLEMIPFRFGPEALPPRARAEQAAAEFRQQLAQPDSPMRADAAILLAYLGHQFDVPGWTTEGLAALPPDSGIDGALAATLRGAWRNADVPAVPAPAPSPTDPGK